MISGRALRSIEELDVQVQRFPKLVAQIRCDDVIQTISGGGGKESRNREIMVRFYKTLIRPLLQDNTGRM